MATSPNCAVPARSQENRRQMAGDSILVRHQIEPIAPKNYLAAGTANGLDDLLLGLGIEPSLTVHEAAAILRWSYWKARRYFRQVDGICVSYRPKRYKRPYRSFTIPLSIFAREWQKMTGHEPEAADVIRQRLALAIQK